MGVIKKNKIHNPQFVTDSAPQVVTAEDIGRIWVDKTNNQVSVAISNKDTGLPELRNLLDTTDLETIDGGYFRGISEEFGIVVEQVAGDTHYDNGYDFFTDSIFIENTTQEFDDYYSYYYLQVSDTDASGYVRTISTTDGIKHVRPAIGTDTYQYNSLTYKIANYSKIVLSETAKDIVDIKFDNKDVLEAGFELQADNKTILIYADPQGFFLGKTVKVRYLV